jgi:RNase P subunit RPR2
LARSILLSSNKCQPRNNENRVPELPKSSVIAKKVACEFIYLIISYVLAIYFCFHLIALAKCQQCNKTLKVSSMKNHLKSHSGVKSHLCELCGRSFVFKSSLNSHIRINHNGEAKPFMCTICGHTCSRKQLLDDHERIHTNERVIVSKLCQKIDCNH